MSKVKSRNPGVHYREVIDVDTKFSDVKIGNFFLLKYESRGNTFGDLGTRYVPVLRKTGETSYEWAGGHLFYDYRPKSKQGKEPKIKLGYTYKNTPVYNALWDSSNLDWLIRP